MCYLDCERALCIGFQRAQDWMYCGSFVHWYSLTLRFAATAQLNQGKTLNALHVDEPR
jgi:hypothetical protein